APRAARAGGDSARGGGRGGPSRRYRRAGGRSSSQFDDPFFSPGRRRGFGQLEGLHSVIDRGFHRRALGERVEEVRHLVGVGDTIAFEEEVLRLVATHARYSGRGDFGRAVVAGLQQALAAEHFEALIVA